MPEDVTTEGIHGADTRLRVHRLLPSVRRRVQANPLRTVQGETAGERSGVFAQRSPRRAAQERSAGVGAEPTDGLDESAVDPDLEVEVVGGRATGAADVTDELAGFDGLALLHLTRAVDHVAVRGLHALATDDAVEHDADAVSADALGRGAHDAGSGRVDRGAGRSEHVGTVVTTAHRAADVPGAEGKRVTDLARPGRDERVARGVEAGAGAGSGGLRRLSGTRGGSFFGLLLLDLLRRGRREDGDRPDRLRDGAGAVLPTGTAGDSAVFRFLHGQFVVCDQNILQRLRARVALTRRHSALVARVYLGYVVRFSPRRRRAWEATDAIHRLRASRTTRPRLPEDNDHVTL
ncbi:hypothetical protein Ddc_22945 [Ditylenchus destructor]|nr:hypothetical protein Ddc_22945 [Ditylenchus destructor]